MTCSCLKNDFNVLISKLDSSRLKYEDISIWMKEEGYSMPTSMEVLLTEPGKTTPISIEIDPNRTNILTAKETVDKECFIDGLYCFSTSSCEVPYTITRAYLPNAECKISELRVKANTDLDWENLYKLENWYEGAIEAANTGALDKAESFIKVLNKELEKLNCCL